MKNYIIILLLVGFPFLGECQVDLKLGYSRNEDRFFNNRDIFGLDLGYNYKLGKRFSIYGELGLEYAFSLNPKTKYFNNFEFEDLDSKIQMFIQREGSLLRKKIHNTIFLSPEINVKFKLAQQGFLSKIYTYSGINTRILLYDIHKWNYVAYNGTLEVSHFIDHEINHSTIKIFNWYLPIGIELQPFAIPIIFNFSYAFSLRESHTIVSWVIKEEKHDNIQFSIGYRF